MPSYSTKDKSDILRAALEKLQKKTPITSIGPGSVARSLAELTVNEIGDFYAIMDFNTSMGVVSTAQGRALDLIGQLFNVERKQLGEIATIDQSVGSFYFFVEEPQLEDITIPQGTMVFTDNNSFIGDEYSYTVIETVVLPAGRTRVFASIRPVFSDSVFTAGANTITEHNIEPPAGTILRCTNPKAIAPQIGYETDENLRNRIIKAVRTTAGGTPEALRFAGLAVEGVRDVQVRNTPYGLGSAEALVVPEDRSIVSQVMADAIKTMQGVRPAGIRLIVREPDYILCDVQANLILKENMDVDPDGTARRAEIGILRYLNRLLPGSPLIYNQLIQSILDASDAISDVVITRLGMDAVEVLRRNFNPESDQQIIPGNIEVATT